MMSLVGWWAVLLLVGFCWARAQRLHMHERELYCLAGGISDTTFVSESIFVHGSFAMDVEEFLTTAQPHKGTLGPHKRR